MRTSNIEVYPEYETKIEERDNRKLLSLLYTELKESLSKHNLEEDCLVALNTLYDLAKHEEDEKDFNELKDQLYSTKPVVTINPNLIEVHPYYQAIQLLQDHSINELLDDENVNQETKSILKDLQDIYISGYQKGLEINQKGDHINTPFICVTTKTYDFDDWRTVTNFFNSMYKYNTGGSKVLEYLYYTESILSQIVSNGYYIQDHSYYLPKYEEHSFLLKSNHPDRYHVINEYVEYDSSGRIIKSTVIVYTNQSVNNIIDTFDNIKQMHIYSTSDKNIKSNEYNSYKITFTFCFKYLIFMKDRIYKQKSQMKVFSILTNLTQFHNYTQYITNYDKNVYFIYKNKQPFPQLRKPIRYLFKR